MRLGDEDPSGNFFDRTGGGGMRFGGGGGNMLGCLLPLVASPFKSAYVAAKHGIAGFTKTIALEVAKNCITVN